MTGMFWNPFGNAYGTMDWAQRLQDELDEWFRTPLLTSFTEPLFGRDQWTTALELTETDAAYEVRVDMPGVKQESIDLRVEGELLTISGERPEPDPNAKYIRQEFPAGVYRRQLSMPGPIDSDKVSAAYRDGLLVVTLPKQEQAQPKRIEVNLN